MTEFDAKEKAGLVVEIVITDGEVMKAREDLEKEENVHLVETSDKSLEAQAYYFFLFFRRLFVDLILSYKEGKISWAYFLNREDITARKAFEVIEVELNFLYDMLYTKAPVAHSWASCVLRFVGSGCIVSALVIFFRLDKGGNGISQKDVGITYALLLGGLALDAASMPMLLFSKQMLVLLEEKTPRMAWLARAVRLLRMLWRQRLWSERTSQMNFISYCLGKPDGKDGVTRALANVAGWLRLREIFDDFLFIRREHLSFRQGRKEDLLNFIFDGLRDAAKELEGKDYEEIKAVCDRRGEGVLWEKLMELREKLMEEEINDVLVGSFKVEFDQSFLMWHIATDLCLLDLADPETSVVNKMRPISKTLSDYMFYLLIKQPEMLSATACLGLLRYWDTWAEARRFFRSAAVWDPDPDDARRMLLSVNTTKKPLEVKGDQSRSVLFDAVILAKVLRKLDDSLMWDVVADVWVEMLTYVVGKCQGSTHVRQVSHGGELITMVWFLMAHMGLGDMYRIQEGEAKAKLIVHDQ